MQKHSHKVILIIGLMVFCVIAKSQQFKTEKEFKNYLLVNNQTLDPIEGIWEFNENDKTGFTDTKNANKNKNIEFPSYSLDILPYKIAIVKASENNFFCYKVDDILGNLIERDACRNFWFKSTAMDGQYIYDVDASCKNRYHNIAIINSDGYLILNGKFEDNDGGVVSWDNFSITAIKLAPTQSEIRRYKASTSKE